MKVFSKLMVVLCLSGSVARAGGPTIQTITVRWKAPGDNGNIGRASRYDLRFSTAPITTANWDRASLVSYTPLPANPGTIQTCTVHGLAPSTTYYFRMKTGDESGNWSDLSNECHMATCGGVCTGITGNVDCSLDDIVDISDLLLLMNYLFISTDPLCLCLAEANVDADRLGEVDISDLTRLTDYMYVSFRPLPPCSSGLVVNGN